MTAYKPDGYPSLSPYLVVTDAERAIAFLVAVLGGVELRRHERPGGGVAHAEVRIDDGVVMLGEAAEGWPAVAAHVPLYVPDVDAAFARAIAFGATPVQEPVRKDEPDRRGGVRDAGGTTWWIATMVGVDG